MVEDWGWKSFKRGILRYIMVLVMSYRLLLIRLIQMIGIFRITLWLTSNLLSLE